MGADRTADYYHERVCGGEQWRGQFLPDLDIHSRHAILGGRHDEYHAGCVDECFTDDYSDGLPDDVVSRAAVAVSILPRVRGLCAGAAGRAVCSASGRAEAGDCGERERFVYVELAGAGKRCLQGAVDEFVAESELANVWRRRDVVEWDVYV